MIGATHVRFGVSLVFENRRSAERAADRLKAEGVAASVRQGRIDQRLSDDLWWVSFDEVQWVESYEAVEAAFDADNEKLSTDFQQRMADLGCVEVSTSIATAEEPADPIDPGDLPLGGYTRFGDRSE